jgi:hypothetical protein
MYKKGIKRDKYDTLFSELIRERANWICQGCRIDFSHDHHSLHCSHIYGRRKQSVRLHPLNALALCHNCHRYLGENPTQFTELVIKILGESNYDKLTYLANKVGKPDKEYLHKHYLAERKRINALRMDGISGLIEFTYL